jgi:enoyl-CoA hydratase/carnithine racemase
MKNSDLIGLTRKAHVAVIDFNCNGPMQPDTISLLEALSAVCIELATDNDIRVVVINPAAKPLPAAFAQGLEDPLEGLAGACGEYGNPAELLAKLPQPVLMGLDGDVFDWGLELALACDFRVASQAARLAMTHLSRGDMPCWGGTQRLSRLVGKGHALNMILSAAVIDGREAQRIGLVNRIVSQDRIEQDLIATAQTMAAKGPLALRYAKEAIGAGMDLSMAQGLRLEADLYFLLHTSRDRREGIQAFQHKRKAEFEGQ